MTIRTRFGALILAFCLALSLVACSSNKDLNELPSPTESETPEVSPSVSPDAVTDSTLPTDFVPDTSAEDICLATTGVPGKSVLFTVNGEPVTAHMYLHWLTTSISYVESAMVSMYGFVMDWTADANFVAALKEDAMNSAARNSLLASKAKELGCDMTDEQRAEFEANLALAVTYMGGEEVLQEELRQAGIDYDTFYAANVSSYYYAQLQDKLFPNPPTDSEMDTYIEENDLLRAKHILLMTVDSVTRQPLDDATIAQKKATAEDILSQLQASNDLLTDFDALMHEYSEDTGLISNPDGYVFTANEMVPEFESGTRALEFNQISGLVESSYGYHIILRLDPDTEDVRAEYASSKMSSQLSAWVEEAEIACTSEYETLDVALFYEKFIAYQSAFSLNEESES